MSMKTRALPLVVFFCALILGSYRSTVLAEELPQYVPSKFSATVITSVGSDSMDDLMSIWVEAYKRHQPKVTIEVQSQGSASAPAALIEGTADIGPMARPMTTPEIEDFELKYGFKPTQVKTAFVGTSIYVSSENPLTKISLDQLDSIFSAQRNRGSKAALTTWAQLGATGPFGKSTIIPLRAYDGSYLHSFFRQKVMLQGEFLPSVGSTADLESLFRALGANPSIIGFGNVGEKIPGSVKELAVSAAPGEEAYHPTDKNMISEQYALSRFFSVYIVRFPGKELDAATKDFLQFVLSQEGQDIVRQQGFAPLPAYVVTEERAKLL